MPGITHLMFIAVLNRSEHTNLAMQVKHQCYLYLLLYTIFHFSKKGTWSKNEPLSLFEKQNMMEI